MRVAFEATTVMVACVPLVLEITVSNAAAELPLKFKVPTVVVTLEGNLMVFVPLMVRVLKVLIPEIVCVPLPLKVTVPALPLNIPVPPKLPPTFKAKFDAETSNVPAVMVNELGMVNAAPSAIVPPVPFCVILLILLKKAAEGSVSVPVVLLKVTTSLKLVALTKPVEVAEGSAVKVSVLPLITSEPAALKLNILVMLVLPPKVMLPAAPIVIL